MLSRSALGFFAAFALVLFALPEPAAAAYPCPNGPGLGEVQVGVSGGSNGVAAVAMCDSAGGGVGGSSGGSGGVYHTYGSVALHPDAEDVWMSGNWNGPGSAEREALAACNRDMNGGCSSIGEWNNSSMSIMRSSQGIVFNGWNGQGGAARKRVLDDCSSQQMLPCEILHSFGADKRRYSPPSAARKLYASAAWVVGEGYDGRLYISSGHRDATAAEQAALAACGAATGRSCRIAGAVGNGLVQPFKANADTSVVVERTANRAKQAAEADCKRRGKKCSVQRSYDSRTSGNFIHDYNSLPANTNRP